ncbi:MAG: hypothetical protein OEV91_05390 [Desulfobulbaceae bacterium]|nr:hypothetical protein [Desulfobulbaceae bacterium]
MNSTKTPLLPVVWLLCLSLTVALAGCTPAASLYLDPDGGAPPSAAASRAAVLLHPFTEAFAAQSPIGSHRHLRDKETRLLIKPGQMGDALQAILLRELTAKQIAAAPDTARWNLSPEGLVAFKEPARLLLAGRITALRINADETLFTGKARAEMEVECVLGLVREQKVIRRNVHVSQEMVTVSLDQPALEKLLRNCLAAASQEILAQCGDLVATLSASPGQLTRTMQ